MRDLWMKAVKPHLGKGRTTRKILYVCELHFKPEQIEKYFVTNLIDGSVSKILRGRFRLAPSSIPSIFTKKLPRVSVRTDLGIIENEVEVVKSENPKTAVLPGDVVIKTNTFEVRFPSETPGTVIINEEKPYDFDDLKSDLRKLPPGSLPINWGFAEAPHAIFFLYLDQNFTKAIVVKTDLHTEVRAKGNLVEVEVVKPFIRNFEDVLSSIKNLNKMSFCQGVDNKPCSRGFFHSKFGWKVGRCPTCRVQRKREQDRAAKSQKRANIREKHALVKDRERRRELKNLRRCYLRLKKNLEAAKANIEQLKQSLATASEDAVAEATRDFPRPQQQAFNACITAAKCHSSKGMRYSNAWILECILIRIQSRRTYLHLRNHEILPLPTLSTLKNHMKKLKPSFGFNEEAFSLLQRKAGDLQPQEKRGVLVVDEPTSPEDSSSFFFQPFQGNWGEDLGPLVKNRDVLHKVILECVILLEHSGVHVDVVTTTWNSTTWKYFGLRENENSCEHPCHVEDVKKKKKRRLWFCCDFAHLERNLRSFVLAAEETWTPDGVINLKHFRPIVGCGDHDHVYTKQNELPQIFSKEVATAMELNRIFHKDLRDCDTSLKFVQRIHNFLETMNSRTLLAYDTENFALLKEFIQYLHDWYHGAANVGARVMPENTFLGFRMSLKTFVEVMGFLAQVAEFDGLMTYRLNRIV